MSPLNFLYVCVLTIPLTWWFYRLAIQHIDDPDAGKKAVLISGLLIVAFFISLSFIGWLGTPDLSLKKWWWQIIPADQFPSRVVFWVLTIIGMVAFMLGIGYSEGWSDFCIDINHNDFGIIIFVFFVFIVIGCFLGYFFNITLFQYLMRLA